MKHKDGFFTETLKKGVERISESAADYIRGKAENVGNRIEERIVRMEIVMLNKLLGMLLIATGLIFLSLSIMYFLVNYAGIDISFAFLIIALIMITAGLSLRLLKGGEKRNGER